MAKVIMTCGKLCSGKSTYARKLKDELGAVILSIDDLMLALFPEGTGEMHDTYVRRTENYLLEQSLQILATGTDVILEQRDRLRAFYAEHRAACEIHYLRISQEEWNRRIRQRNERQGDDPSVYFVDEGLLRKFESIFEEPAAEEADVVVDA